MLNALKCKLCNQKKNSSGYANPFININGIQSHIYSIKKYLTQETLNVDGRIEPKHSLPKYEKRSPNYQKHPQFHSFYAQNLEEFVPPKERIRNHSCV